MNWPDTPKIVPPRASFLVESGGATINLEKVVVVTCTSRNELTFIFENGGQLQTQHNSADAAAAEYGSIVRQWLAARGER